VIWLPIWVWKPSNFTGIPSRRDKSGGMSEMKMPNLLHSPAVKIEGDVTLSSGKPVTRNTKRGAS